MRLASAVLLLTLVAAPAHAQERVRFGIGGGLSLVSGFPERSDPGLGSTYTGADRAGFQLKAVADWNGLAPLHVRFDVLWNRLTSDPNTFSALDSGVYPTAPEDEVFAASLNGLYHFLPDAKVTPYLGGGFGMARFELSGDEPGYDGIGAFLSGIVGVELGVVGHAVLLESGVSTVAASERGSAFVPITLTFLF